MLQEKCEDNSSPYLNQNIEIIRKLSKAHLLKLDFVEYELLPQDIDENCSIDEESNVFTQSSCRYEAKVNDLKHVSRKNSLVQ